MERGTLTLLPAGKIVIGAPEGWLTSEREANDVAAHVKEWQANGGIDVLVLSFPVDVVDLRPEPIEFLGQDPR